jgi:uncharacterized protein
VVDEPGVSLNTPKAKREQQCNAVHDFLDKLKCPPQVARPASCVAVCVFFTCEMANSETVQIAINNFPALGIVQDADRLDSLGLTVLARCATYSSIREQRRNSTILTPCRLVNDCSVHYFRLIKTKAGLKEAHEGWTYRQESWRGMLNQTDCEALLSPS